MAAGHRTGSSRATPSQGNRSEGFSHDIKQNMYGVSARISIRGRRADRPTSGPHRTVPLPRRPLIETLGETTYVLCLGPWLDSLERLPCDGLVLQRPARCPAAGRSEAENRRKIDLPAEARSVPSRPLMNVTITG